VANKTRFLVLEGPDGTGKTEFSRMLQRRWGNVYREYLVTEPGQRTRRMSQGEVSQHLRKFKTLDPQFVYILDRFLLTDIVYGGILHGDDSWKWAKTSWLNFAESNDVQLVVFDRHAVYPANYVDDKTGAGFVHQEAIRKAYKETPLEDFYHWRRTLVTHDATGRAYPVHPAIKRLAKDIEIRFDLRQPELLQEIYAGMGNLWAHFVACVCLNRASGRVARKVVPELLDKFRNPQMYGEISLDWLVRICRPLGFQSERAAKIWQMGQHWDRVYGQAIQDPDKWELLPGVGKYAVDSYRLFVMGQRDNFWPPFDKKLEERLTAMREEGK
jgi:hypothetical protein